jgi:hypothetical protein
MNISQIQEEIIRLIVDADGGIITEYDIAKQLNEEPSRILNEFRMLHQRGWLDISAETHNDGCPAFLTQSGKWAIRNCLTS